ncbi:MULTISPECIES: DUF294 nucleotidyltransferase-like domain-containing protein [unclassified Lentimonas]|uniref:DUF294 nucleotidyltransferase-like domain-containing protein n=1 Tax=unclassified Lentimonas TaxID=2630993 RepID=UPI0013263929|nr:MULTISPECIES: DUF294 nucleotidyltransferase-like domain-containing protein [unclassified Lentimonas]CAA6676281.1 Predicted signal-transduction protein containing cAMP-binding and CBS domains [Lentimonas sp. CC4]CAA6683829.1 Predicted signal-transduction protein containing cAMP-binding and CBS domains [Lentimonas sp. CC6]CAA6692389.1 Predicted signal-transduction protein containing cAMP-binding and CBS domains [Lentimonas sp. CC19]CAA6693955.1 Predicted signal-transduction protein containing 
MNQIPKRVADALLKYPPFSMLRQADVESLAQTARIRAYAKDDFIWRQGDAPGEYVDFLAKGRVEYLWKKNQSEELVSVRDVGDVLGLTTFIDAISYQVSAHVVEESLVYALEWKQLKGLFDECDAARNYVRRHLFWATRVGHSASLPAQMNASVESNILEAHLVGARKIDLRPIERLLSCSLYTSLKEAATLISARRVSSILVVNEQRHPLGIVTSSLLIKRIIVEGIDEALPVSTIMASPVYTIGRDESATAAILLMLRQRIGQICITEDGSPRSPVLDVATHKDLLTQSGHHPAGLLREIRLARASSRFHELADDIEQVCNSYLTAGASSIFMGQICAEFYDTMVERFIEIIEHVMIAENDTLPDVRWSWIAVGSDGRREQLLRTDIDNAMVFASSGNDDTDERIRARLLKFNERVIQCLVDAGFSRCQGGIMASNPAWCKTELEWMEELRTLNRFTKGQDLLRGFTLMDMRHVAGDSALSAQLRAAMFHHATNEPTLLPAMAGYAVESRPPLNFLGKFIVEKKGMQEGRFDIKARGIKPICDIARVLALKCGVQSCYSTGKRLDELGRLKPEWAEVCRYASDSYEFLMRMRTLNGFKQDDSGRYIEPGSLTKLERTQLSNVFDVQRMLQNTLRIEFGLELNT